MQQENEDKYHLKSARTDEIWRELLGDAFPEKEASLSHPEAALPLLERDPWGELSHAKGIEMLDLQQLHLHMSDQDVEQALQIMQEEPDHHRSNQ